MWLGRLGIPLLILANSTCTAKVIVRKISDSNRENATGFRYYLSRPYIAVKKEFPFQSHDVYVQARIMVEGDQRYLQVDDVVLKRLGLDGEVPQKISPRDVYVPRGLQADTEDKDKEDGKGTDKDKEDGKDTDKEKGEGEGRSCCMSSRLARRRSSPTPRSPGITRRNRECQPEVFGQRR